MENYLLAKSQKQIMPPFPRKMYTGFPITNNIRKQWKNFVAKDLSEGAVGK